MLSSLSADISRTPSPPSEVTSTGGLARVIDLTERRPGPVASDGGLHITPALLAALAGSWSGRD